MQALEQQIADLIANPPVGGALVFTYDASGRLIGEYTTDGTPVRRYLWLEDLPLAVVSADGMQFIHADHLHTPQVVTDDSGAIVWAADYTPFGEVTETVSQIEMNLRFPGQYHDRETGLHQNWHREYAPHLGRYTQSDPIGLRGGLNVYSYAAQRPTIAIDDTGLSPVYAGPGTASTQHHDLGSLPEFVKSGTGYGSERSPCETSVECATRCVGAVLGVELLFSGGARKAQSYAQLLSASRAATAVGRASGIGTTYSAYLTLRCVWRCQ